MYWQMPGDCVMAKFSVRASPFDHTTPFPRLLSDCPSNQYCRTTLCMRRFTRICLVFGLVLVLWLAAVKSVEDDNRLAVLLARPVSPLAL